jgi:hypothetical protein
VGQYYLIANLTKRQFIELSLLGDSIRFSGLGKGLHAIALARMLAVFPMPTAEDKDLSPASGFVVRHGCWAGDRVVFAGDHADPAEEAQQLGLEGNPSENLYAQASFGEGWRDISLEVLAYLALDSDLLERLLRRAEEDSDYLKVLWDAARIQSTKSLEWALKERFGK